MAVSSCSRHPAGADVRTKRTVETDTGQTMDTDTGPSGCREARAPSQPALFTTGRRTGSASAAGGRSGGRTQLNQTAPAGDSERERIRLTRRGPRPAAGPGRRAHVYQWWKSDAVKIIGSFLGQVAAEAARGAAGRPFPRTDAFPSRSGDRSNGLSPPR